MAYFANILTLSRVVLTPFIMFLILQHRWDHAGMAFMIAALTDAFDGMWARFYNAESAFGAFMDSLADKVLFIGVTGALLYVHLVPIAIAAFILVRDFLIIFGIYTLRIQHQKVDIKPLLSGKIYACVLMLTIGLMLLQQRSGFGVSGAMMWAPTVILGLVSFYGYLNGWWVAMHFERSKA